MACEDIDLATTLAKAINEISKDLIYLFLLARKWNKQLKN